MQDELYLSSLVLDKLKKREVEYKNLLLVIEQGETQIEKYKQKVLLLQAQVKKLINENRVLKNQCKSMKQLTDEFNLKTEK